MALTDNDIIKALECLCDRNFGDCNKCPFYKHIDDDCSVHVIEPTLDLINRQKAEIERLNEILANEREGIIQLNDRIDVYIAEAIKEFAERLKGGKQYSVERHENIVPVAVIDWIVKEMVGDV